MFPNQNVIYCPACQAPNYSNEGCSNCFNVRNQQSSQSTYSQSQHQQLHSQPHPSNHQLLTKQDTEQSASNYQNKNFFDKKVNDWLDLHPDFAKYYRGKTCQQKWEEANLTYQEAQEWIPIGFTPEDYDQVQTWKNYAFTPTQTQAWLAIGLAKYEAEFAAYLRANGYTPKTAFQVKSYAQNWLDWQYPPQGTCLRKKQDYWTEEWKNHEDYGKTRSVITNLDIRDQNLRGELDLATFTNLRELTCANNQLTNLVLPQPNQLVRIDVYHNLLMTFAWTTLNPTTLTYLDLRNNNLEPTNLAVLSSYVNLRELWIGNDKKESINQGLYNRFTGSLFSLQDCTKLEWLDISNTDIEQGFRDLAANFEKNVKKWISFKFTADYKEFKVKNLVKNAIVNSNPPPEITNLIEKQRKLNKKFDWIDFANFFKIEHLADGGYGRVYSAVDIRNWKKKEWDQDSNVALKSLKRLNENQKEYEDKVLREVSNHHLFNDQKIIKCLGLSQHPDTQEYILVMEYVSEGDLRNFLKKSSKLSFGDKLKKLVEIATGLEEVHDKGLVHKDFHSGNILKKINNCYLTDLGQCEREAEQLANNQSFFGVLPYIAPEVLQGGKYTSAADIYSFGIIMIEMINQLPPHCYEDWNDSQLIDRIIKGFRPKIEFHIPQLLQDLINQCLEGDPNKRPKAPQIKETIASWLNEKGKGNNTIKQKSDFYLQHLKSDNLNNKKNFFAFRKDFHSSTSYHSKWIVTTSRRIIETKKIELDTVEQLRPNFKRSLSLSETNPENKKVKSNYEKWFSPSKCLGSGSFGIVYLGEWKNQPVAIKKIATTFESLPDIRKELKISEQLQHENIIRFLEAYQDPHSLFIIMELANQGTLTDYIKKWVNQDHDWNTNYNFMLGMIQGLNYLHQQKIVHRDLKSMNILINNNTAKLADFGLSKVKTFNTRTSPQNTVGTTRWMAPEVLNHNQPHTYQSDIYSLGMIMWEIASKCTTPFKNVEEQFVFACLLRKEQEIIPTNAPPLLKEIIKDCWKEIPAERISLEQIATRINQNLEGIVEEKKEEKINLFSFESDNHKSNYLDWDEFINFREEINNENTEQEIEALILEQREFLKDWNS